MDVHQAIRIRRSVRTYEDKPIDPGTYQKLLDALRFAPSACNIQPWRFLLIEDKELRLKVATAANQQMWMAEAAVTVVACGYPQDAYKTMGGYGNSVDIDLAIALDHLSLAAAAEGLGTCWIGAFDEKAVKEILQIPAEAKVVAMMPVGHPKSPKLNRPVTDQNRKNPQDIFHKNAYR